MDPEFKRYLEKIARKDFRKDLEPMREAALLLNNPQGSYPVVHIAGTNGKGSTAAFLSSILQIAGYQTGLMTSPHLLEVTERIQINRIPITAEALAGIVKEIRAALPREDDLSYFEMLTLAGFEYFSRMSVDIAVVETGLGGRFDATNIVRPQIVILTPIGMDHILHLGSSFAEIAREKCGILKPECAVVSAAQRPEVMPVIENQCRRLRLELFRADPESITTPLGLGGEHQRTNAAAARVAAGLLLSDEMEENAYEEALASTRWPGRLDSLGENPKILLDAAHNEDGIRALSRHLERNCRGQKIHLFTGVLEDKEWTRMYAPLLPLIASVTTVRPPSSRGLPASNLAEHFRSVCDKPVTAMPGSVGKAFKEVLKGISADEMLVVTGSIYVIGEVYAFSTNTPKAPSFF